MGREHAPETVWRAQELYCSERLPFDRVARETGVSASTLKRWSERFGWRAKREELARAEAEIRADRVLARSHLLKQLIDKKDPQTAYAVSALENLAFRMEEATRKREAAAPQPEARPAPPAQQEQAVTSLPETEVERANLLEAAIVRQLNDLLTAPADKVLSRVREVQAALELVRKLRGEDASGPGELVFGWEGADDGAA